MHLHQVVIAQAVPLQTITAVAGPLLPVACRAKRICVASGLHSHRLTTSWHLLMSRLLAMRWQSASPLIRWAVACAVVAYHVPDGTVKLHLASSFIRAEEAASLAALGRECHWLWEHPKYHASRWSRGGCEVAKLEKWLRCQVAQYTSANVHGFFQP